MAIVSVQKKSAKANGTSVSVTLTSPVTSGNFVAIRTLALDDANITTVQDTGNTNTYGIDYHITPASDATGDVMFLSKANVTNGPQTFTAANDSFRSCFIEVEELSGVAASSYLDVNEQHAFTVAGGGGTPAQSFTTAAAGEHACALWWHTAGVTDNHTAGSGWSLTTPSIDPESYMTETKILGAAGSQTADMTFPNANSGDVIIVSYKAAAAGGGANVDDDQIMES